MEHGGAVATDGIDGVEGGGGSAGSVGDAVPGEAVAGMELADARGAGVDGEVEGVDVGAGGGLLGVVVGVDAAGGVALSVPGIAVAGGDEE